MPANVKILHINPGSDGDGRKWPKHHYTRNDSYFLEHIATDKWIKDLPKGPEPGVTYRLDRLPKGYAGFERQRPGTSQTDRYLYGHPNGQFRSLNEFYPHFKHLMDFGSSLGCECKLCGRQSSTKKAGSTTRSGTSVLGVGGSASASRSSSRKARHNVEPGSSVQVVDPGVFPPSNLISPFRSRDPSQQLIPQTRKLVDHENTQDIYQSLMQKLKDAGPDGSIDSLIEESSSPDWRASNVTSKLLLKKWHKLSRYIPRTGELVLFVRLLNKEEAIRWDETAHTFRRMNRKSMTWLEQPKWEIGVVTQMPEESVSDQDLIDESAKGDSVTYSGFRIEPLPQPGEVNKSFTKQYKHVPLHGIRPFICWQDCLNGVTETDWHPTIKHALTVASSFSVVGRFRFKGKWPNATVFARGVYIGAELILVGDAVRLLPRQHERRLDTVTEVMVVTAIRLRFVNMDLEDEVPVPDTAEVPYQTCLHFSGRVYTTDPTRSFDGIGKVPIDPSGEILPPGLAAYGQWYHYCDPKRTDARIELPYTRILGRCFESIAVRAWYTPSKDIKEPLSSFQPINVRPKIVEPGNSEISRGIKSIYDARLFSQQHDKRIKLQEGRLWYWADTRIEQLDLYEVNGRYVGLKNGLRTIENLAAMRKGLKMIDREREGLEEGYHAAKDARKEAVAAASSPAMSVTSPYKMFVSSMRMETESSSGGEKVEMGDPMEIDEDEENEQERGAPEEDRTEREAPKKLTPTQIGAISLDDSEGEEELAKNLSVSELMKNIRANQQGIDRGFRG